MKLASSQTDGAIQTTREASEDSLVKGVSGVMMTSLPSKTELEALHGPAERVAVLTSPWLAPWLAPVPCMAWIVVRRYVATMVALPPLNIYIM